MTEAIKCFLTLVFLDLFLEFDTVVHYFFMTPSSVAFFGHCVFLLLSGPLPPVVFQMLVHLFVLPHSFSFSLCMHFPELLLTYTNESVLELELVQNHSTFYN